MSSFLVLGDGDTRNRWRDGQVCPDVGQGTMAPWARRLGRRKKKVERERGDGEKRRVRERRRKKIRKRVERDERSPPCMEKRAESEIGGERRGTPVALRMGI
ncbi:hypothetical protein TNCV_1379761 [Trichonephila clavipes]|nr:hypothetical protein TNCV_1379761 [Trichonephila clavipes]